MPSLFGSRKSPRSSLLGSSGKSSPSGSSTPTTPTKVPAGQTHAEKAGTPDTPPSLLSRSVPTISISTPDSKYSSSIQQVPNQPSMVAVASDEHESWGNGSGESSPENESQPPSLTTGSTSPSIESLESVQEAHNAKAAAAVAAMQQGRFGGHEAMLKDKSLVAAAASMNITPSSSHDSSADGTALLHSEFGFCADQRYRYVSQHHSGTSLPQPHEEEPSYVIVLMTYLSYLVLICFGHMRDFIGRKFLPQSYIHLMESNGYAPLNSDFDSFYTRRLKKRMDDCFSRPVTGVCGRTVLLLDRVSADYHDSFSFTGKQTRALNVSAYNYLGFAQSHGGCSDAVKECLRIYGVSSFGSRLGAGHLDLQQQTEKLVARFVGHEDAVIVSMGFATNSTTIPAITGPGTLIISDEYNHSSIRFGSRLSGAHIRQYKHNDMRKLEALLRECISQGMPRTHRPWKKIVLIVEGLYSMEGTLVNLPELLRLKEKYKFYLYVDEAHSIGAIGPNGRGVCDYFGVNPRSVNILMGTLTKSFGAAGGYIAGDKATIDRVRLMNHANVYGETLSPPVLTQIMASMASIMGVGRNPSEHALLPSWMQLPPRMLDGSEGQERLRRLAFNARYLSSGLRKLGFLVWGSRDSPIVPLLIYLPAKMSMFSRMMLERTRTLSPTQRRAHIIQEHAMTDDEKRRMDEINDPASTASRSVLSRPPIAVVVVAFPATPILSSRVRFCVSAAHTKKDIDDVLRACEEVGTLLSMKYGSGGPGGRWEIDEVIERYDELVRWDGATPL